MTGRLSAWLARRGVRQPDKVLHVLAGLPVGLLAPWLGLWALWLGALLAWGEEWRQKRTPGRTYDGWDAFATLLGALLGATLAPYLQALHGLIRGAM